MLYWSDTEILSIFSDELDGTICVGTASSASIDVMVRR